MKTVLLSLFLLIIAGTAPAWSQEASCPGDDPTFTRLDTLHVTLELGYPNGHQDSDKEASKGHITLEVFVDRSSNGQIRYSINPMSLQFTGEDGGVIDAYSTREIFRLVEQAAIAQGILEGYTPCTPDCRSVTVNVCQNSCVSRSGQGVNTSFAICDASACCTRTYQVCCPDGAGAPVTRLVSVTGAHCDTMTGPGQCESICW